MNSLHYSNSNHKIITFNSVMTVIRSHFLIIIRTPMLDIKFIIKYQSKL